MSLALYRKWRPDAWEKIIGQEHVVQTLRNAIAGGRVGHAYLFSGPRGTGKTTTARLLSKAVNCLEEDPGMRPCNQCEHCTAVNQGRFLDLIEIDAASNTSVDDVRELRERINLSPSQGKFKVYIIDEVHMLSTAAFNALLKTLEEPPPHAIFILATTEVHKIPATVLSRCQRHEFRRIPVGAIVQELARIAAEERMDIEPDALKFIARQSTGGMRDAISLLDQLGSAGEKVSLAGAQNVLGTAASQSVVELVDSIIHRSPAQGMDCISRALDGGSDPRQYARQMVEYLRSLLLIKMNSGGQVDATAEQRVQMAQHAAALTQYQILEALRLFNTAAADTRGAWQPGLLLEMACAEMTALPDSAPAVAVIAAAPVQVSAHPAQAVPSSAPAEAQAEALVAASPAPGEGESIFQSVVHNWARIRVQLKGKSPQAEALLNSCKPMMVRDGALILGFPSDVLKGRMETKENMELTRQAIQQVTGANLPIVCTVTGRQQKTSAVDVDEGGLVQTLISLGGKVVHKE